MIHSIAFKVCASSSSPGMHQSNISIWSPAHIETIPEAVQRFQGHNSVSPTIDFQKYSTTHQHPSPTAHYGYSSVCYSNVDYLSGNPQQMVIAAREVVASSYKSNPSFQEPESPWAIKPRDDSWLYNSHWENMKK